MYKYFRIARVGKKESDEDSDKEDEDDDWTFVPEKRSKNTFGCYIFGKHIITDIILSKTWYLSVG